MEIIIQNIPSPETALVFLGGLPIIPEQVGSLPKYDIVIAADSGLNNALLMNIEPNIIVGDMDSIDKDLLKKYEKDVMIFLDGPNDQDACDGEKSLRIAVRTGVKKIIVITAGGGRLDHQLAIFALLFNPMLCNIQIEARWGNSIAFALQGPIGIAIEVPIKTTMGLIPFGGDAEGIETSGLKWPLKMQTLKVASSMGVSNESIEERVRVSLAKGCLLITIEKYYNYTGCNSKFLLFI